VSDRHSFDPTAPLIPSGNLRRRQVVSRIAESGATIAAAFAVGVLGVVFYTVASRGLKAISWNFLVKGPPLGVGPDLVGTAIIVAIGTAVAMPVAVLIALYMTEFAGARGGRLVRLTMDVMNGLPSIVIGVFVFGLLVEGNKQMGIAGSIGLAIIEVPLIARGTQEVLLLLPRAQREAADALGVARWRSVLTIVLPSALGGIVTATVLSVARAAGETAPLLLASSVFSSKGYSFNPFEALPNVPVRIYTLSEEANPEGFTEAWGLSLIMISFILFASLGARALLTRSKRKLGA
jgi:phosphate transport system permease protein